MLRSVDSRVPARWEGGVVCPAEEESGPHSLPGQDPREPPETGTTAASNTVDSLNMFVINRTRNALGILLSAGNVCD